MNDYRYDHQTVQGFILSSLFWGVVGILIGLLISVQMFAPALNFAPWASFGRLRTVHTNILGFGLVGEQTHRRAKHHVLVVSHKRLKLLSVDHG